MHSELTACDPNDTLHTLAASVGVLLHGVPRDQRAVLPGFDSPESREQAWHRFVTENLRPVQATIYEAYQGAIANRLEDILSVAWKDPLPQSALELTQTILLTSHGARHERVLSKLAHAAPSAQSHPCVALAVRAAAFNEPVVAAQVAYFYQEWQAASSGIGTTPLLAFLESQPATLLTLSPALLSDPQSPFMAASQQQYQQHHG